MACLGATGEVGGGQIVVFEDLEEDFGWEGGY